MRVHCFCPVEKMFCNELVCNYRLINAAAGAPACPQLLLAYVSRVRALTGDLSFVFFAITVLDCFSGFLMYVCYQIIPTVKRYIRL